MATQPLRQGDKNRGELFDLTGQTYSVLAQTLQQLKDRNLVKRYFAATDTLTVLTDRLHTPL